MGKLGHLPRLVDWLARLITTLFLLLPLASLAAIEAVMPAHPPGWTVYYWDGWSQPDYINTHSVQLLPTPDAACQYWLDNISAPSAPGFYTYLGSSPNGTNGAHCNLKRNSDGWNTFITAFYSEPRVICPAATPPYTYDRNTGMCQRQSLCPAHASGTPCVCDDGYVWDVNHTSCLQERYTLELTPKYATIEPGKSYTFTAKVTNQDGGTPSKPVPVSVKVEVDPGSGGHAHDDASRPKGSVAPAVGENTLQITFTSTAVSGTHTISATCELCENKTETAKADVMVDGLKPIPDSRFYAFTGAVAGKHMDNHYLTPAAADVLLNMAIIYRIESKFMQLKQIRRGKGTAYVPPSVLHVNDGSLIWGGKFDIHGKWGKDTQHMGHKRGVVVDIRANQININNGAIPLASFDNFADLATLYGADAQVHCGDAKRQPPTCVFNGTEDDGRHFHVLLLGVDK